VLNLIFDSKLQLTDHVAKAIAKTNHSLNKLKLIEKYFNMNELINFVTTIFYSFEQLKDSADTWCLIDKAHMRY
jgi:hypothetical protein